jgi:hypothetical protein
MRTISHMWVYFLQNHGETEKQCSSKNLFSKKLHRKLIDSKSFAHHFSLGLHSRHDAIVYFSESLFYSIHNTLGLPGVVFVQFLGHWLKKLLPVVPAVLELKPLIREA